MDVITLAWWEAGIIVLATIISISYFIRSYVEEAKKKAKVGMCLAIILRWEIFFCAVTSLFIYASSGMDLDMFLKLFPGLLWLLCFIEINIQGIKAMEATIKGDG